MNHPLKALLVGCGGISDLWLEPAKRLPSVELVGLVDLVEETARGQAERFGFDVFVGTDLEEALTRLEPDVVFNCTVPAAHFEVTTRALEMHPGFVVYHPEHVTRLRGETRDNVGVNFDPSHLFWQQVDIVRAIRYLGETIYHFHAKDTHLDPVNLPLKGVLDTVPYDQVEDRSWVFRSVGYGHGALTWKRIISALRTVGYDGVISIEHEDALASPDEGLRKAVETLRGAILSEPVGKPWWTE